MQPVPSSSSISSNQDKLLQASPLRKGWVHRSDSGEQRHLTPGHTINSPSLPSVSKTLSEKTPQDLNQDSLSDVASRKDGDDSTIAGEENGSPLKAQTSSAVGSSKFVPAAFPNEKTLSENARRRLAIIRGTLTELPHRINSPNFNEADCNGMALDDLHALVSNRQEGYYEITTDEFFSLNDYSLDQALHILGGPHHLVKGYQEWYSILNPRKNKRQVIIEMHTYILSFLERRGFGTAALALPKPPQLA